MKKRAKAKTIILSILAVILLLIIIGALFVYLTLKPKEFVEEKGIILSSEELPAYLARHALVKELPKDANIKLSVGENKYLISNKNVKKIDENYNDSETDIEIKIPEESVGRIGEVGLCQALGEMIKNENVKITMNIPESEFLWKYKDILKYKKCIT